MGSAAKAASDGPMSFKTVTIDFDNDYQKIFPTLKGVSSGSGDSYVADGDIPAEGITSEIVDGVCILIAPDADAKTPSRIWASSPRLRMYSGSFAVMPTTGEVIKKIEPSRGRSWFRPSKRQSP